MLAQLNRIQFAREIGPLIKQPCKDVHHSRGCLQPFGGKRQTSHRIVAWLRGYLRLMHAAREDVEGTAASAEATAALT